MGLEKRVEFKPEYRNVPLSDNPRKYSPIDMSEYDKERHVNLQDAYAMVEQSGLSEGELKEAIKKRQIQVYEFKGNKYVDRLDVGRVYHSVPEQTEGIEVKRYFTKPGEDPFESVKFVRKNLSIVGEGGKLIFQMNDAEIPEWMDDVSAKIVAQKYFFNPDKPEWKERLKEAIGSDHEFSLKHLNKRVADFFTSEGDRLGYFKTEEDREAFRDELYFIQVNGMGAFNSPVQFNAGLFNSYGIHGSSGINYIKDLETGKVRKVKNGEYIHPQTHACFIKGPNDNLESLAQNVVDEFGIFASGSGVGHNCDNIRGDKEKLSGGGNASGPISFDRIDDTAAGAIKSGGKTRRAARWLGIGYKHRDVMQFIRMKVNEDKKAKILIENGFSGGMDGEAYGTVSFQNTNLTVRLDDDFFSALKEGRDIELYNVGDGEVVGKISADRMLKEISYGSWRIGDPAVQYESKMNEMHTAKNSGRQRATNPCGEYSFLDNTSCNLFSHRLTAFLKKDGSFDVEAYKQAVKVAVIAQDIANQVASYPVKEIALISPEFSSIGTGFADLGALLMRKGIPYDSEKGRAVTGAISALMTGTVYETSIELAKALGTFTHYEFNRNHMLEVMGKHQGNLENILWNELEDDKLKKAAYESWKNVLENGEKYGFRNAQATVLAPTGTISFLMGCSTTGIEPAMSLSITKNLAGGGEVTIANKDVEIALNKLGYTADEIKDISTFVGKRNTLRNAPHVKPEHYEIFDTAFGNAKGEGSISIDGHLKIMSAAQPFISGAISKTNNLPHEATVKDIYDCYIKGYELGLKGITMFRDDSKPISALSFGEKKNKKLGRGEKEELPTRRDGAEWEVQIGGTPFHLITSEYEDGRPGQITFLSYKAGSTLGAMLTTAGISASKALKRGVNLEDAIEGWGGQQFEPSGLVLGHPFIKTASSVLDFAYKVLKLEYLGDKEMAETLLQDKIEIKELRGSRNGAFRTYARAKVDEWNIEEVLKDSETGGFVDGAGELIPNNGNSNHKNSRGRTCNTCGNIMQQSGPNCFECKNCGDKVGGCGA
jgi:ribonucleoside-diphosphate reductase alpha chain